MGLVVEELKVLHTYSIPYLRLRRQIIGKMLSSAGTTIAVVAKAITPPPCVGRGQVVNGGANTSYIASNGLVVGRTGGAKAARRDSITNAET